MTEDELKKLGFIPYEEFQTTEETAEENLTDDHQ